MYCLRSFSSVFVILLVTTLASVCSADAQISQETSWFDGKGAHVTYHPVVLKLAQCLSIPKQDAMMHFLMCRSNELCWMKQDRRMEFLQTVHCIRESRRPKEVMSYDVTAKKFDDNLKFVASQKNIIVCLATCLKKSLMDVIRWFLTCKLDVTCWITKLGIDVGKCLAECTTNHSANMLHLTKTFNGNIQVPPNVALERKYSPSTKGNIPEFVKCLAKCMGKSLADVEKWIAECGKDIKCWMKHLGVKALKCVPKCILQEQEQLQPKVTEDVPEFVKCMARCLGDDLSQVVQWFEECNTNLACWAKKVGVAALQCVPKCLKLPPVDSRLSHSRDISSCLKCAEGFLPQVPKWMEECKSNMQCWVAKVGSVLMTCLPKCMNQTESWSTRNWLFTHVRGVKARTEYNRVVL